MAHEPARRACGDGAENTADCEAGHDLTSQVLLADGDASAHVASAAPKQFGEVDSAGPPRINCDCVSRPIDMDDCAFDAADVARAS